MNANEQEILLVNAQTWFRETILPNHLKNTKKLKNIKEFNINPFLASYIGVFMTGELTAKSIAQALIYPRVLGTSITTSFGTNMQKFISDVLKNAFGSTTQGIDIEFTDCIDGKKKYCQVKLGPNTINKDDVVSINGHFQAAKRLGRTNGISVGQDDLVVGILYGVEGQESNHYKKLNIEYNYPLFIGKDFWHRLTGSEDFYQRLISAIAQVVEEANGHKVLDDVITSLSKHEFLIDLAKKTN